MAILLSPSWPSAIVTAQETIGQEEVERVVDVIRRASEEARDALEQLPDDRFETGAALEAADYEGREIVDWVERETRWVPYRGSLRGADGVLLDRKGNSLDRSLLLTRLLEDAGYETRLARGRLSAEAVEALLSRSASPPEASVEAGFAFPDEVRAAAARAEGEAAALATLADLEQVHTSPGVAPAAADHWWVQARLDDDWVELDPLLPGALATLRPEPVEWTSVDELPDALFHEITVSVVIERWEEGETVEEVPLEYSLRAAEAPYHDLELQFVPFHFEPADEGSGALAEALAIAETTEEWLPVVRRGGEVISQRGFDREGNLERDPGRVEVARKMEAANRALSATGRYSERVPSRLSACWLEYRIDVPERAPEIVRREIFDLIGPVRRSDGAIDELEASREALLERGSALLGVHRILVTSAELPPIALERAARELWVEHGPQLAALVRVMHEPTVEEALGRMYRHPLVALDLLGLAAARHALSPHPSATYLGSPNILTTHFTVDLGGSFSVGRAFDLVVNEVGVAPAAQAPATRIRMAQGVLDTILEAALSEPDERSGNAAELFAQRGEASGGWHRVEAATEQRGLSEESGARIAVAMAAGQVVVAPKTAAEELEVAWWEIDPATGTTVGIGSKGWGQSATEEMIDTTGSTVYVTPGAKSLGWRVNCRVLGAFLRVNGWMFRNLSGGWTFTAEAMGHILEAGCGGSPFLKPGP